jgi:hypothetical protein
MKTAYETKKDNSIATYIAGGVFVQVAQGLATEFQTDLSKEGRYTKNKLEKAATEVEKIVRPIGEFLHKSQKQIAAEETNRLVDLMSDIAGLSEEEYKRVNNILNKIKDDRRKKLLKTA